MNRIKSGSFALLPSKFVDADSGIGRHRVICVELFEKATENRR